MLISTEVAYSEIANSSPKTLPLTNYIKKALSNWLGLLSLYLFGASFWSFNPHFQSELSYPETLTWVWNAIFIWTFGGLFWEAAWAYVKKENYLKQDSNSVLAWKAVFKGFRNINEAEQMALLFFAVRLFYLPLMVQFFFSHFLQFSMPSGLSDFKTKILDFAWLENTLYLLDTIPFALAYFLNFGNFKTRSTDNSLWGWFFCLACYPPFNMAWGNLFPYSHIEGYWGGFSLFFIGIYVSASLALGLRAGHLQYRGLCQTGPYAIIRHPAYAAKNIAWLIGALGWTYTQMQGSSSFMPIIINSVGAVFWAWIYHQRAITEEKHLSKYPEYRAYCQKVKYRYIPFVY